MSDEQRESELAWVPPGVDPLRANIARVYDYLLGGGTNFAADRAVADCLGREWPDITAAMRAQRAFVRRAVRFLARTGVRQFLDVGSGIPTVDNVHQIARSVNPDSCVVYVDIDAVAVAHTRMMLRQDPYAEVILADVRRPWTILADPDVVGLFDFEQPIAVLLCYILHFLADEEEPARVVATFMNALAPGSALVLSHGSADALAPHEAEAAITRYQAAVAPLHPRTRDDIALWLDGLVLVEPGLTYLSDWRPDPGSDSDSDSDPGAGRSGYGVVAWKP